MGLENESGGLELAIFRLDLRRKTQVYIKALVKSLAYRYFSLDMERIMLLLSLTKELQ